MPFRATVFLPMVPYTFSSSRPLIWMSRAAVLTALGLTLGLDWLEARSNSTAFYWSESALFGSFWLLFLPLWGVQQHLLGWLAYRREGVATVLILMPLLHVVLYPWVVSLLSGCLLGHTYDFVQTFRYALTEYSFVLMLMYGGSFALIRLFSEAGRPVADTQGDALQGAPIPAIKVFVVAESQHKRNIPAHEVAYISANPPYSTLHHPHRRYLYPVTLKALSEQLDPACFVRIHKSTIVNLTAVLSWRSRLNGDYDLTLVDGTVLRLSRHYAADFKARHAGLGGATLRSTQVTRQTPPLTT